eukprot:GHVT01039403.1.p1 GENE.GHVT01039403.1~~GHVT01039403.1.p1  ORF type:complete len:215 (-),score=42.10 GHVT01039403.1:1408-2052(-)
MLNRWQCAHKTAGLAAPQTSRVRSSACGRERGSSGLAVIGGSDSRPRLNSRLRHGVFPSAGIICAGRRLNDCPQPHAVSWLGFEKTNSHPSAVVVKSIVVPTKNITAARSTTTVTPCASTTQSSLSMLAAEGTYSRRYDKPLQPRRRRPTRTPIGPASAQAAAPGAEEPVASFAPTADAGEQSKAERQPAGSDDEATQTKYTPPLKWSRPQQRE